MFDLNWYNTLNRPLFTPDAIVFQPAWTFLYLTIFVSFILFATKKTSYNKLWGYILFFAQLGLNLIWTPIFFYFHNIALALAVIVLMVILVFWNIAEFIRVSKTSGFLLIPYLMWILFATYLNAGFLVLN